MSDKKISQLTASSTLTGGELVPIVQGGVTVRTTAQDIADLVSAFTKTKAEIDALIAGGDLVAGALYEITGVHPTLYDDGTTSGTTVYLRAISGSELEVQGMGKFYNPKYNQSVNGFGIWDNKMYGTLTSIVGQFNYINKEGVTANNGATGLMLAQGMIQWVSGDWSVATSIEGDVSGATASISGFVSPAYSISQKVIWGGYSWTNLNGNVGASVDVLNLDAEWTKDTYDAVNYNIAYDLIEYDYANDMIIRRFEKESNVDVKCSKAQYDWFYDYKEFTYHSISVQQFGNAFNISTGKGQLNVYVDNGYNECINFSGAYQTTLTFGNNANQNNLTFGNNAGQNNLTFGNNASQVNLTFGSGVYQDNLTFGSGASQVNLTFGNNANQVYLTFGSGAGQVNLTFGSGASQYKIIFGNNASQAILTLGSSVYQQNITFTEYTQLDFNNQTISSNIEYVSFRTKAVSVPNLSSATYIYDGNIKEVYQRPDGALKIRYYDNSDVLQIVDIED